MRQICDMYGMEVTSFHKSLCPFHHDSKPSMQIYDGDSGWWCFVCGTGGSTIDFVARYFGLTPIEAVKKINADFGLGLPLDREQSEEERKDAARIAYQRRQELARQKKARQEAIDRYYGALSDWVDADTTAEENAPKSILEPVSDAYALAVKARDMAAYRLDLAADELYLVEKRE